MANALAVAETTRDTDGTARRTTRPQASKRAARDDMADQLATWMEDHDDDTKARIVGRFRL